MISDMLFYAICATMLAVVLIVALGIGRFGRDRQTDRLASNRLMRARLVAQGLAVVLIVAYVAWTQAGG